MAALLLTGGASRRMGFDKARMRIGGVPAAVRIGRITQGVCAPVLEVGPGHSGLPTVRERDPGGGPLQAILAGWTALRGLGAPGPVIVLSTDLPLLNAAVLVRLRDWPGEHSIVPLHDAQPQPLCARWSARDLSRVGALVAAGERSLKPLLASSDVELTDQLGVEVGDADTPEELDRLGLEWTRP